MNSNGWIAAAKAPVILVELQLELLQNYWDFVTFIRKYNESLVNL